MAMKALINKIAENMLNTRPRAEVKLRPYIKYPGISREILSYVNVNLDKIYPDAAIGDFVRARTYLLVPFKSSFALKVKGNVRIIYKGKEALPEHDTVILEAEEGLNELEFICTKDESGFSFSYAASTVYYPGMWASDYLYWIRPVLAGEYSGEEGVEFSAPNGAEYVLPAPTLDKPVDFSSFNSRYILALTYAKEDCEVSFDADMYVDGKKYCGGRIPAGAQLAVIFDRSKTESFDARGAFWLPMLASSRQHGIKWMFLELDDAILPEIQFKKPYKTGFWRLSDGSYIRPYLDTSFYGKWFYALMVGQYGLLKAAEYVPGAKEYFTDSMSVMADYFDYMRYDAKLFGAPSFLERSIKLEDLDSIGTIGMNMCELYRIKPSENVRKVIKTLYSAMCSNIPRFPDGVFHRGKTMWADDTFMSCPFLARLGELFGMKECFDECVRQIEGFYKRLYIKEEGVCSHIYFIEDKKANKVPWGRGNGWVMLSISEVLKRLPAEHEGRESVLRIFRELSQGIAKKQDSSGMWHQVLDMPETYEETSCTGMFSLAMLRGVKNGWIDKKYMENVEKGIAAIKEKAIDEEGNILGVCRGSQCSYDPMYYARLGTVKNDDHGTGIILALLSEYNSFKRFM